jgi:hypothetical protein
MSNLADAAEEFLELVLSSSSAIALTGVSISRESDVPDYCSPEPGFVRK